MKKLNNHSKSRFSSEEYVITGTIFIFMAHFSRGDLGLRSLDIQKWGSFSHKDYVQLIDTMKQLGFKRSTLDYPLSDVHIQLEKYVFETVPKDATDMIFVFTKEFPLGQNVDDMDFTGKDSLMWISCNRDDKKKLIKRMRKIGLFICDEDWTPKLEGNYKELLRETFLI